MLQWSFRVVSSRIDRAWLNVQHNASRAGIMQQHNLWFSQIRSAPGLSRNQPGNSQRNSTRLSIPNGCKAVRSIRRNVFRNRMRHQCNVTRSRLESHVLCSVGATLVPMVASTDLRNGDEPASVGRLHRTRYGAVLVQSQVCAAAMVQPVNTQSIMLNSARSIIHGTRGLARRYGYTAK